MLLALKPAYCVLYQIPNLNSREKAKDCNNHINRERERTQREQRQTKTDRYREGYTKYLCIPIYMIF